jgi:voltage-gated potassium channel
MIARVKKRLYEILEPATNHDRASRAFDLFIITLITLNVLAIIMATVERFSARYFPYFQAFEVFSVVIFTIEYILRIWTCDSDPKYRGTLMGRVRFIFTPLALIDLMAILPFYLPMLIPLDLRYIRIVRLFRFFRLLKTVRYSESLNTLCRVLKSKKEELVITLSACLMLLVIASSLIWAFENNAQPDKFGSIPAALWWGVVTLTTVGYGDIYPVTTAGKVLSGIISLIGIGLIALPAGILASGFVEEIQKRRAETVIICPHCGKDIVQSER